MEQKKEKRQYGVNEVLKPVHPRDIVGKWFAKLADTAFAGAQPNVSSRNLNDDAGDHRDLDNPARPAVEVGLKWSF